MRGDFSRLTFDPARHYAGVLHQQGRVWLDADWNEDVYQRLRLLRQHTRDVVGASGAPSPGTGFDITCNPDASRPYDFRIAGGHYYVQGILCELATAVPAEVVGQAVRVARWTVDGQAFQTGQWIEIFDDDVPGQPPRLAPIQAVDTTAWTLTFDQNVIHTYRHATALRVRRVVTYETQPDFPGAPPLTMQGQSMYALVYLETWQRLITYLEDDELQEVALGGPDTTTRLKTVAQVKVQMLGSADEAARADVHALLPPQGRGTLTTVDPDRYTGRENHLYRVEIHHGGDVIGVPDSHARTVTLAQEAEVETKTLVLATALSDEQISTWKRSGVAHLRGDRYVETVLVADVIREEETTRLILVRGVSAPVSTNASVTGGAARFKWSRNNASFAVRVTDIREERRILALSSLGRDQATTLRQGDLVEISDDASDLGPARGHLTYLDDDPDPDLLTVHLLDPLPDAFHKDRHLTLRRWDGVGWAQATFDAQTTPDLDLQDGVHIQFGGSGLQAGDYWQFTTRSVAGSGVGTVESLTRQPPTGIIRYRTPLAVMNWSHARCYAPDAILNAAREARMLDAQRERMAHQLRASGRSWFPIDEVEALARDAGLLQHQIDALHEHLERAHGQDRPTCRKERDHRQRFEPATASCCDCTVTVAPGDSLSAALRRIPSEGGVICLLPGIHRLAETVNVYGKRGLMIRGAGTATVVTAPAAPVALQFEHCDNLTLRDFAVNSGQQTGTPREPAQVLEAPENVDSAGNRHDLFGGVITLVGCRAASVTGCTVRCSPLSGAPERACIVFCADPATLRRHLEDLKRFRPSSDLPDFAASSIADLERLVGASPGIAPIPAQPHREAHTGTMPAADLTVRDCRLYAGAGQSSIVVADGFAASLEDNWCLALAALEGLGSDSDSTSAVSSPDQRDQRGSIGLACVESALVSVTNNLIVGFTYAVLTGNTSLMLRDNTSYQCGEGLIATGAGAVSLSENIITADSGMATLIESTSGRVILDRNNLVGVAGTRSAIAVAEIIASAATLTNNSFQCSASEKELPAAVAVVSPGVTYTANRSVCATLPRLTNVGLFARTNGDMTSLGSITALSNICLEPAAPSTTTPPPAEYQTPPEEHRRGWFAAFEPWLPRIKEDIQRIGEGGQSDRISLLALGEWTVSGFNIVTYTVVAQGTQDLIEQPNMNVGP